MTGLLGHEFHHSYLRTIIRVARLPDDSADAPLVSSLLNLLAEGVADLIDKPDLLAHPPESLQAYATRYLRERDTALQTLRAIDGILSGVSRDTTALRHAGTQVTALLWAGGHPVGG